MNNIITILGILIEIICLFGIIFIPYKYRKLIIFSFIFLCIGVGIGFYGVVIL